MKQTKERVAEIQVSYRPAISNKPVIISALDAFVEIVEFFPSETIALQEKFVVMYLNRCNRMLGVYPLSTGGITGTMVATLGASLDEFAGDITAIMELRINKKL